MTLTTEQSEKFHSIAEVLGHNVHSIRDGSSQSTLTKIETIERARAILSQADGEERTSRTGLFMDRSMDPDCNAIARHDRAEAFVFADHVLEDGDHHFIKNHLPMPVHAISIEDKTLAPGEVWDLGTSGPAVVLNLGTLTMGPGSSIVIRNSVLSMTCQNLIRQSGAGGAPGENYDIAVLGANPDEIVQLQVETATYKATLDSRTVSAALVQAFTAQKRPLTVDAKVMIVQAGQAWRLVDFGVMRTYSLVVNPGDATKIDVFMLAMQGAAGPRPADGAQGPKGTCKCSGTEPGDRGGTGYPPADSGGGGKGTRGNDGLPSLRSEINIGALEGVLVLRTAGGNGAMGGMGGMGGDGAKGGKGGNGERCAGTCTWGGHGGKGGKAGAGGPGGNGGNGGFAADLFVTVPASVATQVTRSTMPSLPGLAGPGGLAGAGGPGGDGGDGVSHNICGGGNTGPNGDSNVAGDPGEAGKTGGIAGRIVINGVG